MFGQILGRLSFVLGTKGKGEDVSTQSVLSTAVGVFDNTPALAAGGQHNKAARENITLHYCYNETMTWPEEIMETISFYCYRDFYKMCYSLKYFRMLFHIIDLCQIG